MRQGGTSREQGDVDFQMLVQGRWVGSSSGQTISSIDPYTGEPWCRVPNAAAADIDAAVSAAREAFLTGPWPRMTGSDRSRLLRNLAALLDEHGDELAHLEVRDTGKLLREMTAQLREVANYFHYFAGAADKFGGEVLNCAKPGYLVYTLKQPIGVVAGITAWNSPALLLAYKLAPALATGCTFVAKPHELASASTLAFGRLVEEAGFPPGVFNVVTGGADVGKRLISNSGIDKVAFTGSTEVGIRVLQQVATRVVPVTLELGGKSANIVFADADLDAATEGVIAGIFAACGQSCVAGSRLLVQREVHDELVGRVVSRARLIRMGDPMLESTEMGPLVSGAQVSKVLSYVRTAEREGAAVVTGGRVPEDPNHGLFLEPTVLVGVRSQMTIAREEVFGPVLSVIPFTDEEEAIALNNQSYYGLAAGIWTRDVRVAHRVAERLQAGTVWVNTYRVISHDVPNGGNKLSGYGREGGMESLEEYLQTKSVWIETAGAVPDPFRIG